jgi:short subunit dehydrogenase-like uncharacterized protein
MIYGATGYTGTLLAEEALRRGHQPVLAGRSRERLAPLAQRLGLKYVVFDLNDVNTIAGAIADMALVLHAAGPFIDTAAPMLRACLATKTHYLDITGEIAVFENIFHDHETALKNGIALIGGVGFDVVPTDCLALYVTQQVPAAHTLEIAFDSLTQISSGTFKSALGSAGAGGQIRRDGVLQPYPIGRGGQAVRFSHGERYTLPIPWGDLATAYRSTGVPNITTLAAVPRSLAWAARLLGPLAGALARSAAFTRLAARLAEQRLPGPGAALRETGRSYVRARALNREGTISAEAWLETVEPYRFTAEAGVRAVEQTLDYHPVGALTPAQAFGVDFVLDIPGTVRLDRVEGIRG